MADSPGWTDVVKKGQPTSSSTATATAASHVDDIPDEVRALLEQAEQADKADAEQTQREIAEAEAAEQAYGIDDWRAEHGSSLATGQGEDDNNDDNGDGTDWSKLSKSQKKKKKKEASAWQTIPQAKKKEAGKAQSSDLSLHKGVFGQMTAKQQSEQQKQEAAAQRKLQSKQAKQAHKLQQAAKKKGQTQAPGSTSIRPDNLTLHLKHAREKYPESIDAQLKSLAEVYARSFDGIEVSNNDDDHLQLDKALEKPLCHMSTDSLKVTVGFLKTVPRANLLAFIKFMVPVLAGVDIPLNPKQTPGIKILLQIIARQFPSIVAQSTGDLLERLKSTTARPYFLWWVAQIVLADPVSAAIVWGHVLVPLLARTKQKPQYQAYMLHYLEAITSQPEKVKLLRASKKTFVPKESLEVFLNYRGDVLAQQAKGGANKDKTAQLSRVMVAVLNISVFLHQEESPRNYFPTLFRLASTDNVHLRTEILKTLMHCLARDPACMEMWEQLYPLVFRESVDLMACIESKWKSNPSWLNKGLAKNGLETTVSSFIETNMAMKSDSYEPPPRIRKQLQAKPHLRKISKEDMERSEGHAYALVKILRGRGIVFYVMPVVMTVVLAGMTFTHLCKSCGYDACQYILTQCEK